MDSSGDANGAQHSDERSLLLPPPSYSESCPPPNYSAIDSPPPWCIRDVLSALNHNIRQHRVQQQDQYREKALACLLAVLCVLLVAGRIFYIFYCDEA